MGQNGPSSPEASKTDEASHSPGYPMSQSPPAPPSLAELRKEIDTIDEGVHRLLM